MKAHYLALVTALLGLSVSSFAAVDASSVKIKVYGVSVSLTADCANPVTVFESASGTEFDFVSGPTLGGGSPADGTYQCVMITMSDVVKVTPSSDEGVCHAGVETSTEVCQSSEATDTLGGTTFTHANCVTGADKVTLFLTTGSTRTNGGNAFIKPTSTSDPANGYKLAGAFTVAGSSTGTFVADFTGKVDGLGGPECGVNPPVFGFR